MKCPLLVAGDNAQPSCDMTTQTDCLKERCAWFDKDQEQCADLLISTGLWVISKELREMKEEMPHEGQF